MHLSAGVLSQPFALFTTHDALNGPWRVQPSPYEIDPAPYPGCGLSNQLGDPIAGALDAFTKIPSSSGNVAVHDQVGVSADNQIVTAERGERPYTIRACLANAAGGCGESLQSSQPLVPVDVGNAAETVLRARTTTVRFDADSGQFERGQYFRANTTDERASAFGTSG